MKENELPLYQEMFLGLEPRAQSAFFELLKICYKRCKVSQEPSIFDVEQEIKKLGLQEDIKPVDDFKETEIRNLPEPEPIIEQEEPIEEIKESAITQEEQQDIDDFMKEVDDQYIIKKGDRVVNLKNWKTCNFGSCFLNNLKRAGNLQSFIEEYGMTKEERVEFLTRIHCEKSILKIDHTREELDAMCDSNGIAIIEDSSKQEGQDRSTRYLLLACLNIKHQWEKEHEVK